MKKLLIGLLVLVSMSAFSGTIINEETNQRIVFSVSKEEGLVIDGSMADVKSKIIPYENINYSIGTTESEVDNKFSPIFFLSNKCLTDDSYSESAALAVLILAAVDIAMLPITAPLELIHDKRSNKDSKIIGDSFSDDKEIVVKNSRFQRIIRFFDL